MSTEIHPRTARLIELMTAHRLKCDDVAELLERKSPTVRIWRTRTGHRPIPADALALLEVRIAARQTN